MKKNKQNIKTIYPKLAGGQKTFSTSETARILRLKRERLRQWGVGNFIPSGVRVAWGEGYRTVWSRTQIYTIALFQRLVDAGLNRKTAAACSESVDWVDVTSQNIKYLLYVYHVPSQTKRVAFVEKPETLVKLKDEGVTIFINLEEITRDIDLRF